MRHFQRRNLRNAGLLLGGLCCLLAAPVTYVVATREVRIVPVYERCRQAQAEAAGVDTPGFLEWLLPTGPAARLRHALPHRPRPRIEPLPCLAPDVAPNAPEAPGTGGRNDATPSAVAEPSTIALLGLGAVALIAIRRRT